VLTVSSLSLGASGSQTGTAGVLSTSHGTDTDGKLCAIGGCKNGRINKKCIRQVCAAHCRVMGGCTINQHTTSGNTRLALSDQQGPPPLASVLLLPDSTQPRLPSPAPLNLVSHINEVATTSAEPPSSMNPLPNPRFASQMRPIFTEQMAVEQSLQEKRRLGEAARLVAIKKVKHTVIICAWLKVRSLSSCLDNY